MDSIGIPSLFDRLGGTSGVSALVDDIVDLHMENPTIKARFRPILETPDRLFQIKQHLCAFIEMGGGGLAQYAGRSMQDAHRGMNICDAEYVAAIDDILIALDKRNVDEQTRKDVLSIAYALKDDIVRR